MSGQQTFHVVPGLAVSFGCFVGRFYVLEEVASKGYKAISPAFDDAVAAQDWQRENETSFPEGRFTGRWGGLEWEDVVRISE